MRQVHRATVGPLVGAVMSWVLLAALPAGCSDRPEGPPARTVVVYCSADQEYAEPILAAFQEQTGIRVEARYDDEATKTVGLVQRLRAEAARPTADVFWSNEIFHTVRLADEGLFEPCDAELPDDWPAGLRDPQGLWHGFALRGRVIAYHTGRVSADEAPGAVEDLLDPKWKGRLVMASPEFGTTGGQMAAWLVHYGPERMQQILEGLKANKVWLVAGNSVAVRMVAQGQADVCLTDTDDVYAAQRNQWPVAMKLLGHGASGSLVIPNTAALIEGAPHAAEGRALVGYLLSAAVETSLARSDAHNTPARSTVAAQFPQYQLGDPLDIDYRAVAAVVPEAIRMANQILK